MPISRSTRQNRISAGLCARCGKSPPSPGVFNCDACRQYVSRIYAKTESARRSVVKKDRVRQGLCRCGRSVSLGFKHCDGCLDSQRRSVAKLVIQAQSDGRCVKCKLKAPEPGRLRCSECLEKHRAKQACKRLIWAKAGLCLQCGRNPSTPNYIRCERCRTNRAIRHQEIKLAAFTAYGGPCCKCCGERTPEFLTIDHINGGGNHHRRTEIGTGIYRWLQMQGYPAGYQVLCFNCNAGKGAGRECPHHKHPQPDYHI